MVVYDRTCLFWITVARFYGRQLITPKPIQIRKIISQIEAALKQLFFSVDLIKQKRVPTVKYHTRSKSIYLQAILSDLLTKETGQKCAETLHFYLIEEAKNNLIT